MNSIKVLFVLAVTLILSSCSGGSGGGSSSGPDLSTTSFGQFQIVSVKCAGEAEAAALPEGENVVLRAGTSKLTVIYSVQTDAGECSVTQIANHTYAEPTLTITGVEKATYGGPCAQQLAEQDYQLMTQEAVGRRILLRLENSAIKTNSGIFPLCGGNEATINLKAI